MGSGPIQIIEQSEDNSAKRGEVSRYRKFGRCRSHGIPVATNPFLFVLFSRSPIKFVRVGETVRLLCGLGVLPGES